MVTINNMATNIDYYTLKTLTDLWYNLHKPSINVVAFGKTGIGKSTLINSLLQQNVAETGDMEATTKYINRHHIQVNNVNVNFYDTPRLFDDKDMDPLYLRQISPIINKASIILVCFDITDKRLRREDIHIIQLLDKLYGRIIWDRSVVVLTFANEIPLSKRDHVISRKVDIFHNKIKQLTNMNVPIKIAGMISEGKTIGKHNWFMDLWLSIFKAGDHKAQPAFIKLNFDSLYDQVVNDKQIAKELGRSIMNNPDVPNNIKHKIEAKVRKNGCFYHKTIIQLCNGKEISLLDVKIGDSIRSNHNKCSKVYYKYIHNGKYHLYYHEGTWLTGDHLVKYNNQYVKAKDISNREGTGSSVVYILTNDNHILINNQVYSVHSHNHYIGIIKGYIIKLIGKKHTDMILQHYNSLSLL
jgi:small GTP-binding protein